jgi:O-antigen/teichoic acid export membrane protein
MKLGVWGLLIRGGYALADQILSSGTNFAAAIIVARLLGPADYGSYAIVYGAWIMVMSFARAMIIQPYVVKASALKHDYWLIATRRAAGVALGAGLLGSVIIALVGFYLGMTHAIGKPLLVMSFFIPVLLLQDFWRAAAFSIGLPQKALVNDAMWTATQAIAFLMIWLFIKIESAWIIAGWGAGALAGAILGIWQFQVIPNVGRNSVAWLRKNAALSGWFGLANFFHSAGAQAIIVLITATAGRAALGGIQSVNNLFGPAQLIASASQTIGLPMASKARAEGGPKAVRRIAFRYALIVGLCMTAYGSFVVAAGPNLLNYVFGEAYSRYGDLILPLGFGFMLTSWGTGAAVGLISSAAGRELAVVQLLVTLTQILLVSVLGLQFGAVGAAWGLACGAAIHVAGVWLICMITTRPSSSPSGMVAVPTMRPGINESGEG